jgi:hypothetical protein
VDSRRHLFSVYELQAEGIDTLDADRRRRLMGAALTRGRTPPRDYFERIWLYNLLNEALETGQLHVKNVAIAQYTPLLAGLLDRSVGELQTRFKQQHDFLMRYEPIVMAYRHGRTVFPVKLTMTATDGTIERSPSTFTAFRGPSAAVELTMDEAYHSELSAIREITKRDLKNLTTLYQATDHLLAIFLNFLDHPTTELYRGPFLWILIAQPETEDERRVLEAYQRGQ